MRILIVHPRHFYGGGDSTYAFQLADLLRRNGHAVAFFSTQNERNIPDENDDLFISGVNYRQLNEKKTVRNGLKVMTRSFYSLEAREKIKRLITRFKPDLVHSQGFNSHITASIFSVIKQAGIPHLQTLHEYTLMCPNSHFFDDRRGTICEKCMGRNYFHCFANRCKKGSRLASLAAALRGYIYLHYVTNCSIDAFIAPGQFFQSKLISFGIAPEKIFHIPNFLHTPDFEPISQPVVNPYYLYFGRMESIKGLEVLIKSFEKSPAQTLKLVGPAEERAVQERLARLPANIQFLGGKYGDELKSLIRQARAVIIPSIWYENQPYTILESFALGRPVIASNLGGMAELVEHGERGLLFAPNDAVALQKAVLYSEQNTAQMDQMGLNASIYVRREHSASQHYNQMIDLYSHVCHKKS